MIYLLAEVPTSITCLFIFLCKYYKLYGLSTDCSEKESSLCVIRDYNNNPSLCNNPSQFLISERVTNQTHKLQTPKKKRIQFKYTLNKLKLN